MLARAAARRKEIACDSRLEQALAIDEAPPDRKLTASGFWVDRRVTSRICLAPILLSVIPKPRLDIELQPNAIVFAYMFLLSLITGVVFGLAPAIESTKPNLTAALRATRHRTHISLPRLRQFAGDWPGRDFPSCF